MITWNGLGSFTISAKPMSEEVTVVTDPYEAEVGLKLPRSLAAALVVSSHDEPEASNTSAIEAEHDQKPFVITHGGEFEVKGVFVRGVRAPKKDGTEHTLYRIDAEDISIGFLGAIDRELTDPEIEALGTIDVLILPVGGGSVLTKDQASAVVSEIEPRLVIPSYFEVSGLKKPLGSVEPFCRDLACPREDVTKLKITKAGLPTEEIRIAVINRS